MDQATKLRERVQTNQEISNARVIAITSGKGGVGKTTLSVNIALELARRGKKVVVFDADFGLANVEVMLGIRPQYNLLDLIHNNKSMTEIITQGPEGIGFISGGSGVSELATLDNASIKLLISELVKLDQMYDVVIIDTGAGITDSVMEFVMMSPEVVLVVTPEPTSITDSYSLLKVLRRKNSFNPLYKTIHVVANRVENEAEGAEIFHKIDTACVHFRTEQLDFSFCCSVCFHTLESFLCIVKYHGCRIHRDSAVRYDCCVMPSLLFIPVHDKHIVCKVFSESKVFLIRFFL